MPIKAVAFRVLLRAKKPEMTREITTDSGLKVVLNIATDEKMEQNAQITGTIVDIGPDVYAAFKTAEPFGGLKVGDVVFYPRYAGKWIPDPDTKEEFLMLNDEDICGKYEPSIPSV